MGCFDAPTDFKSKALTDWNYKWYFCKVEALKKHCNSAIKWQNGAAQCWDSNLWAFSSKPAAFQISARINISADLEIHRMGFYDETVPCRLRDSRQLAQYFCPILGPLVTVGTPSHWEGCFRPIRGESQSNWGSFSCLITSNLIFFPFHIYTYVQHWGSMRFWSL